MFLFRVIRTAAFLIGIAILVSTATNAIAASAPISPAQLALYQGADREKILIEGAKKESQLTFYNSHTWFRTFVKGFEKKYPFIKVSEWRNDSKNVLRRMLEEAKSARSLVDVVETTPETMGVLKRYALLQNYYSPEARYYPDELKPKGKTDFSIYRTGRLTAAWDSTPHWFRRPRLHEASRTYSIQNGRVRWRSPAHRRGCDGSAVRSTISDANIWKKWPSRRCGCKTWPQLLCSG